jgi:hypothetical protein
MIYAKPPVRIPIREEVAAYREPTLEELLSDTIVEAMMRADAVDPEELTLMLRTVARTLRSPPIVTSSSS